MNTLVILALLAGVASVLFGGYQSTTFLDRLEQQKLDGRNILIFSAADTNLPVKIDRDSCEDLMAVSAVDRAGLVEQAESLDILQFGPDVPMLAGSATLFPLLTTNDAVIGSALADEFTSRDPFRVLIAGQSARVQVAERQPSGVDTNSALIVSLPPQNRTGTTCLVVLNDLVSSDDLRSQISARLKSSGGPLAATQVFTDTSDPLEDFLSRSDRFFPLLLGLLGGIASGILNRLRSGEMAAYRLSGTTARSLYLLLLLEQILLAGFLVFAATAGIAVLNSYFLSPFAAAMWAFAAGCVWIVAATLITADMPLRKPPDLAKDRG